MKLGLVSDIHAQYSTPICRTDDYVKAQIDKLEWLKTLPVDLWLCGGDVYQSAREDRQNELNNILYDHLPEMYGVAGNHDLLQHSLNNLHKSGISNIIKHGIYHLLGPAPMSFSDTVHVYGASWKEELPEPHTEGINIGVIHKFILGPKDPLKKHITAPTANKYLRDNRDYDLILTGDNHQTFIVESGGKILINPGSLVGRTASQKDFKPSVFIYDTETRTYKQVFVPIQGGVVSDAHLSKEESIDFGAYIETLKNTDNLTIDFIQNLVNHIKQENISNAKLNGYIQEVHG